MRRLTMVFGFGICAFGVLLGACSAGDDSGTAGGAASAGASGKGGNGGSANGSGQGGSGGINLGGGGTGASSGAGGVVGGNEDKCDGIDNDGNGIIDDVDVGKDGVCDCLRIATLGVKGNAGVSNIFDTWLNARSNSGATDLNDQVLTSALLSGFQVIVAQNVSTMGRIYAQSEVDALSAWVKAGGGFMTMIGYADPSEIQNVNTLLAAYGMSYGSQQILYVGGSTTPVTHWVAHPVTNGITEVGIDNGYPVQGSGTMLANEQSFNVLQVQDVGKGHVLMWGDEWITFDTEWAGHPEYQVELFWLNIIKWLTPPTECQVPIPTVT